MTTNTNTTARYDKTSPVVVNTSFSSSDPGLWSHDIREEASNVDMTVAGTVVEQGYMYLRPATDFAPTEYSGTENRFTQYNG